MKTLSERRRSAIVLAVTVALAGCTNYVKQDQYDTLAKELANRIRIDIGAAFATGDATLGEDAKPFLQEFARALASRPDAVVTVEGFADSQGPTAYNYTLGERRAQAEPPAEGT